MEKMSYNILSKEPSRPALYRIRGKEYRFAQNSLFLMSASNKFRYRVIRCITSPWFDRFIILVILANSIALGMTDYTHVDRNPASNNYGSPMNEGSWRNTMAYQANNAFTYVFAVEMVLKIIARGFLFGDGVYLKDGWNFFDFIVVVTSLIALLPSVPNVSIFRSFRVLRPLRNVSALPGLRKLIQAFLQALPELGTVIFLLSFVFMIFSILGLSLFMGSVNSSCRLTPFPVLTNWTIGLNFTEYRCLDAPNVDLQSVDYPTQASSPWHVPQDCYWPTDDNNQRPCAFPGEPGNNQCYQSWCGSNYDAYGNVRFKGETTLGMYGDYYWSKEHLLQWGTFNSNFDFGYTTFDNIFRAYVTVFESITLENWSWIMYMHMDTNPPILPAIYCILLSMLGAQIGLNLLLAVLEENFVISKDEDPAKDDALRKPLGYIEYTVPKTAVSVIEDKRFLYSLVSSKAFNNLVTCVIILNTVILASDHYPSTPVFDTNINAANFTCTLFFLLDMLLKMAALGIREYCNSGFNLFDALIVLMSIIELCISPPSFIVHQQNQAHSKGLSAFRILRLLRLFKLAKQWKTMMSLIEKMTKSIGDMGYLLLLLGLFIYISGLIGLQFFANKICFDGFGYNVPIEDPRWTDCWISRAHYNTLPWALFNTLNIMTAENWNNMMYDGWRATETGFSFVYFMSVVILGQFLGMSMFLAILLSSFSASEEEPHSVKKNRITSNSVKRTREDTVQDLEAAIRTIIPDPAVAKQRELGHSIFPLCAERSLFVFGPTNPIRVACAYVVSYKFFDTTILLLIVISSICLVLDNPLLDPNCTLIQNLSKVDVCLTACFCLEMALKITALGFFFQPRAYLRSSWNLLDFIVVFVSLTAIIPSNLNNSNMKALKSLRAFRAFRPLRMVSRIPSLKKVVDTLFVAIPGVADVMTITLFFFLVFGIVCVNLFKGQMRNCALGAEYDPGMLYDPVSNRPNAYGTLLTHPKSWNSLNDTEKSWFGPQSPFNMSQGASGNCSAAWPQAPCCTAWPEDPDDIPTSQQICECWGSSWVVWWGYWTFDNIGEAMLTLYQVSSTEGWVYLMLETVDQNGLGMQPIRDNNMGIIILHVAHILLVHFFAMNLVVGVILENFQKQTVDEEFLILTEQQQIFVKTQKIVACLRPYKRHKLPSGKYRQFVFRIVEHSGFELFILICIFANTLTMGMQHNTQSASFILFLTIADYFFCCIFTTEAILKLFTFRWAYFSEAWNKFDFIVVAATDVSLVVSLTTGVSVGPVAQVVRSFRVGRIIRLLNGFASLNKLIGTLMSTMIGLANIGALWILVLFIFSVLGMQLYAKAALPSGVNAMLNNYYNFQTFSSSLVTLFSFSGGEYWDGFSMALGSKVPGCVNDPPYDPNMCGFTSSLQENPQNGCEPLNGCGSVSGIFYMCVFYFFIVIVMLNLCVGVIIDDFSNQKPSEYLTETDFQNFVTKWSEFDVDATLFIDYNDLFALVTTMSSPWRVDPDVGRKAFYLKAVSWRLKVYKGNKIHFYDVIHALTKEVMSQKLEEGAVPARDQNFEDALTKILQVHHLDEIEPEMMNGVEVGMIENLRIQTFQKAWKDHQAWKNGKYSHNKNDARVVPDDLSEGKEADSQFAPSNEPPQYLNLGRRN